MTATGRGAAARSATTARRLRRSNAAQHTPDQAAQEKSHEGKP